MINEKWTVLDEERTRKFIEDVRDKTYAPLFAGEVYELWAHELPFFDGYYRYRLNNCAALPYFSMDYISNGEDHYYLDGSDLPVRLLMMRDCVRLTQNNVLDYLDFFDDIAFNPNAKVKFIVSADDTGYSGASAMGHHFKAIEYTDRRTIEEYEDHFLLVIPALYNGKTVQAHVRVGKDGDIRILAPVEIRLVREDPGSANPLGYAHPMGDALLTANREILSLSDEGKRLWDTIEHYKGELRIVTGLVGIGAFSPSTSFGFITAPATLAQPSPYQVIALAGALREIELQLMGEYRGQPKYVQDDEVNEFAEINLARNLDIWLKICTIIDEIEASGQVVRFVDVFRKAGFEEIYTGYKNGSSLDDLTLIAARIMGLTVRNVL